VLDAEINALLDDLFRDLGTGEDENRYQACRE